MRKKIIDFSSAYAQLILLVFLPIVVLAAVGAYLVEKESSKAIKSEQHTLATAALIRYEPMVKQLLPIILKNQDLDLNNQSLENNRINLEATDTNSQSGPKSKLDNETEASEDAATQVTNMSLPDELKGKNGVIESQQIEKIFSPWMTYKSVSAISCRP